MPWQRRAEWAGSGGIGDTSDELRAQVAAFRAVSNGSFQLGLGIPEPAAPANPATDAAVKDILARLGGTAVPEPVAAQVDFDAQLEALLDVAPPVAVCTFGVFATAVALKLRQRGIV